MEVFRKKPEVTTAIILDTRIKYEGEKHPVKLRITYQRKQSYYTIKKELLTKEEFNKVMGDKPRGTFKDKRRKYQSVEERAIQIIDNVLTDFSFDSFIKEFKNTRKKDVNLITLFNEKVNDLKLTKQMQSIVLYNCTLKSLTEFDKNLSLDKITPRFLENYQQWMLEKKRSYTTIAIYMRNLRHIINTAIKRGIISSTQYPFGTENGKYRIPQGINIKKALNIKDIEKLFKYKPKDTNELHAHSYWVFSYLCNGMNMVDIANLKYQNIKGNNLVFIRQKTINTSRDKKEIAVYLLPETLKIIQKIGNKKTKDEDYVFPIFSKDMNEEERFRKIKQHIKNTNKYIQQIAGKIGLDGEITTYWARHSMATILKRSGASIEYISEQLGHQTTKVTRNYLDSFEDEHRKDYTAKLLEFKKPKNKNHEKRTIKPKGNKTNKG